MDAADDNCAICEGDVGWWAVDEADEGTLSPSGSTYCGVCRPWREVVEVHVDSLLPWQRSLIRDEVLGERLRTEDFRRYGGGPRVLRRWVEILYSSSRDRPAREAIRRVIASMPDRIDEHWAEATRGLSPMLTTNRVRDIPPSPPETQVEPPPHSGAMADFFGHRVRVYRSMLEVDGELIDGGPLLLLARGLLECDRHQPRQGTAVMSLRALHHHLGRDPVDIERLIGVDEGHLRTIYDAEDDSIPWCNWDARGYMIENPAWMRRLTGIRRLRLPDSLFLCDWFSQIWHGWYGEDAANELKLACMHWMRLAQHIRDGGIPAPIRSSFKLLRSLVGEQGRINASPSGMIIEGTSGMLWMISPVPVRQHPFYMRVMDDRMHMQFWRVTARAARLRKGSRMHSVCLHPGNRRAPLGDQIATLCLGLLNDELMARRIGQISGAIRQHISAPGEARGRGCDLPYAMRDIDEHEQ